MGHNIPPNEWTPVVHWRDRTRQVFVTNNVEKKVPDDLIAVPKPPPDVIDLALNDLCLDFHNEGADAWPPAPPARFQCC